jgi:hypothetical protein
LQEPNSTRDPNYRDNFLAEYYLQAVVNAKLAGAAAWCFHTMVAVDMRSGSGPPFLEDRLRAYPEPEWAFVNSLNARVLLRASNGVNYMAAQAGGGFGVQADWTAASPGSWNVFGVSALSGGPLVHGDRVAIAAPSGKHFLQATAGGGSSLSAAGQTVGAWETFILERSGSGAIRHGEPITLRANDTPFYMTASGGGGGSVSVNGASRGSAETFTLLFVTPHSAATASIGPTAAAQTKAVMGPARRVSREKSAALPVPRREAATLPPASIIDRPAEATSTLPLLVGIGSSIVDGVLVRTAAVFLGNEVHIVKQGDTLANLTVRRIGPDDVELAELKSGRTFRIKQP